MNIIIPLGGKGERFITSGYTQPKPMINIFDKTMIEYVIDNLNLRDQDKLFIIYNIKLDDNGFFELISEKYSFINLIKINKDTKGAVETLFLGIPHIIENNNYNNKCLILDCDTFYKQDIVNIYDNIDENIVFYTKNEEPNPIYSYIELNKENIIINIKEKIKISNNANTGAYGFNNINILYNYCKYILDNNITFNNEPYTSCIISEMIKDKLIFKGYELNKENVFSLGTPYQLENYKENTFAFLFDLDGTLVITDEIYFGVWSEILLKYNIILTKEIFINYIQGNNDKYVLNTLLININIELKELSELKDKLFIENISKIKIIEGIYEFIIQVKSLGYKMCIVTNCNKNVAKKIIKYIKIDNYVDFIISSDDCINGKPNIEPYKKAMEKYNITNDKCFIFEDSKTGILSANGTNPKLLVGIQTIYNENELMNIGVNYSIKNYVNLKVENLINNELNNSTNIIHFKNLIIENSFIDNIKDLIIDNNKLKGGFIADVISYIIITNDNNKYSQILKFENPKNKNDLSFMARQLDLYNREYYFYTDISSKININIPKFYNLIKDKDNYTIGLVLENLFDKQYKINLNLNNENIDFTLLIINNIAKMHSKFWNKNLKKIFPKLKNSTDSSFYPFFSNFIKDRYNTFKNVWFKILNNQQIEKCNEIYNNFSKIQERFSEGNNLTFIHGDIKSPNIFYYINNNNNDDVVFIDWQHCAIGKGVQDLIFFIIESFDILNIKLIFNLVKIYYYKKIIEYGVINYSMEQYESDLYDAICYIPFFTSIWFGTTPQDELIDKNFPYFFISKMFYLLDNYK